jgi:hypothetical protein
MLMSMAFTGHKLKHYMLLVWLPIFPSHVPVYLPLSPTSYDLTTGEPSISCSFRSSSAVAGTEEGTDTHKK